MKLLDKLRPKDLIAVIILGVMLILDAKNNSSTVALTVSTILGYYFGRRHTEN